MLNNLFKVSWRQKNAGIICYMLTSLACLQQENVKKSRKLMKLANIDEENLHIFLATWGTLMKFSEKMCLIIILKVTKKQGFTSSVENTVLKKPQGGDQIDSPSLFRVKKTLDPWQGSEYSSGSEYTRILNVPGLHKVFKKMQHYRCLTGFRIFLSFQIWQGSKYGLQDYTGF